MCVHVCVCVCSSHYLATGPFPPPLPRSKVIPQRCVSFVFLWKFYAFVSGGPDQCPAPLFCVGGVGWSTLDGDPCKFEWVHDPLKSSRGVVASNEFRGVGGTCASEGIGPCPALPCSLLPSLSHPSGLLLPAAPGLPPCTA